MYVPTLYWVYCSENSILHKDSIYNKLIKENDTLEMNRNY